MPSRKARHAGPEVRLEVGRDEVDRLFDGAVRRALVRAAHRAGFARATADLDGYRTSGPPAAIGHNDSPLRKEPR